MKHSAIFGAVFYFLLSLCIQPVEVTAQSPFMQENAKSRPRQEKIDTIQTNIPQIIDRIDAKMNRIIYAVPAGPDILFDPGKLNWDTLQLKLQSALVVESAQQLHREGFRKQLFELQNKVEGLSKEQQRVIRLDIEKLQQHIKTSDSISKLNEEEKLLLEKEMQTYKRKLDTAAYAQFLLNSEKTALQHALFKLELNENIELVSKLRVEAGRVESALDSQVVGINRTLSNEDANRAHILHKKMYRQVSQARTLVQKLSTAMDTLSSRFNEYQKHKERMEVIVSLGSKNDFGQIWSQEHEQVVVTQKRLTSTFKEIKELLNSAKTELATAENSFNDYQEDIAAILKQYNTTKTVSDDELKTVAGITQPLSEAGRLVPNISLLGYKGMQSANTNWSAQLKLFVGTGGADKSQLASAYKIFIPEASNYGFMADFSFGFIPSNKSVSVDPAINQPVKKIGFNVGTYYLGKSLFNPLDSTNFKSGMLQFKLGFQYVVIGKALSFYGNLNPYLFSDGVETLKQHYAAKNKLSAFIEFGINAYLDPAAQLKSSGFFIDFDLGFVVNSGDVKSISQTEDVLLPRIRINLVKAFNF